MLDIRNWRIQLILGLAAVTVFLTIPDLGMTVWRRMVGALQIFILRPRS